ncbi:TlyA family RNA methyltransferase [Brevundimonas naejangsanensis]
MVKADGRAIAKPSEKVAEDAVIEAEAAHRWVGRGALKLERALDLWPVAVEGRVVLDIGASTGGFTEVCLDRGAARIFAVDVGTGQLHSTVAADPRVVNLEKTDARDLTPAIITDAPSLIVCDASFISLLKVLPVALELAASGADLITLVKPQFEAEGPKAVGKKGVVKDPEAHAAAVARVRDWLEAGGWSVREVADSPITGGDGNVEFLLWAQKA